MGRSLYELRHAVRRLTRSPGFVSASMVTLALGIGANSLIFSVVNAVFLRPLSYRDAGRLVWASEFFPNFNRFMAPAPDYAVWKGQSVLFERLEAMGATFGKNLTSAGKNAERVETAHVTPGFFSMAGISPRLGAGFAQNTADRRQAMVSDTLWRGYFGADPGVVGRSIALDGKLFTIVGVMPRGFVYPDGSAVAIWLPDAVTADDSVPGRNPHSVRVIGRLKNGVTIEQARAELERLARAMDGQYPAPWAGYHAAAQVRAVSLQKQLTADSTTVSE